jgi:hypothetical protein
MMMPLWFNWSTTIALLKFDSNGEDAALLSSNFLSISIYMPLQLATASVSLCIPCSLEDRTYVH